MRILSRIRTSSPADLKACYMSHVDEFETKEQILPNRLKLRRYLRELISNQRRIHQITKENATSVDPNKLGDPKQDDDAELRDGISISDQVMVYLQALDYKLDSSEAPFFDGKAEP